MLRILYPCPYYEGIDDTGEDIYSVFWAFYDEKLGGFPTAQFVFDDDIAFRGSYDDCCDFLEKHS